jgi:hypothetical protein
VRHATGFYPRVRVDTSGVSAVGQAGGVLLVETVRASGLDAALMAGLSRWRKPLAVHDPAKVLLDATVALASGADCSADVAVLRAEPGAFGRVASDPTVSRTLSVLAGDADQVLAALEKARAAARVWQLAGEHAPDHQVNARSPLIIDLDATLVTAHSEKEQARPTFKRGRVPLVVRVRVAQLSREPDLVSPARSRRRAHHLDAAPGLHPCNRSPGSPVGAETAPAAPLHHPRRPGPNRARRPAAPRRQVAWVDLVADASTRLRALAVPG